MKSEVLFGLLSIGFFILVMVFLFWAMSSYPGVTVSGVVLFLLWGGYLDWRVQKKIREEFEGRNIRV